MGWLDKYQKGGFLEPTSKKLPNVYNEETGMSNSEVSISIGGEDGEPAYLIPSFKNGKFLDDPIEEFRKTGDNLGGPFNTWQEAEEFGQTRHEYVEKGQNIPTPLLHRSKKKQHGGWLDGFEKAQAGITKAGYEKENELDFEGISNAVRNVESLDGKLMWNNSSTATGLYGQRFSEIKDDYKGTRKDFAKDTTAQNKYFKNRFYEGLEKSETTPLEKDANELYEEYSPQFEEFEYSKNDLAVLSNFLGRSGTRQYLGYHKRDGKPLEEVLPKIYGKGKKQANKTPEEYLDKARKHYQQGGNIPKAQQGSDPTETITSITTGKDFVKNWMAHPETRKRYRANMSGEPTTSETNMGVDNTTFRDALTNIDKTTTNIKKPIQGWGGAYSNSNIDFYGQPSEGTATHEYTHAAGEVSNNLSDYLMNDYGPLSSVREKIGLNTTDSLRQAFNINGDFATEAKLKQASYMGQNGELYPRIMEMRQLLNVKPGQLIDDEMIQTLINDKKTGETAKFYTPEKLKKMLNTVADSSKPQNTNMAKNGVVIEDDRGQWDHPGEVTKINSNDITMKGVNYPVLGVSNTGDEQLMMPGEDYKFDGESVTEYPMAKKGWADNYAQHGVLADENKPEKVNDWWNDSSVLTEPQDIGAVNELEEVQITGRTTDEARTADEGRKEALIPKKDLKSFELDSIEKVNGSINDTIIKPIPDVNRAISQFNLDEAYNKNLVYNAEEEYGTRSNDLNIKVEDERVILDPALYKTKDQIKSLQTFLKTQGYNMDPNGRFRDGGIDGVIGKVTLDALDEYNNRPVAPKKYKSYKEGDGFVQNCKETQCSEYVQNTVFKNFAPDMNRLEWNDALGITGDAWHLGKNILNAGGSRIALDNLKAGDVVGINPNGSQYRERALKETNGKVAYTHTGVVDKVNADGSYYVLHNWHENEKGKTQGKEFRTLIRPGKKHNLTGKHRNAWVVEGFRPAYGNAKYEPEIKVREDIKITPDPKKLELFSKTDKSLQNKKQMELESARFVEPLNNFETKKKFITKHGMDEEEYQSVAKITLGILAQESGFGTHPLTNIKPIVADVARVVGIKDDETSKGAARVKWNTNFKNKSLNEFGINKENYTEDSNQPIIIFDIIAEHYKNAPSKDQQIGRTNKKIEDKKSYIVALENAKQHTTAEQTAHINKAIQKHADEILKYEEKLVEIRNQSEEEINTHNLYNAIEKYNKGRVTKYSKDYDVDYTNKVLNFSNLFTVQDEEGTEYNTQTDTLGLQPKVQAKTDTTFDWRGPKIPKKKSNEVENKSSWLDKYI